jgi:hypothetical protein
MQTIFRNIFLCAIMTSSLWAENSLTSSFEFLRTDFSPRTAAMSNSFTALRGDINGQFINPAGLAYVEQRQYYFNYTNYLLDINGGAAGYAHLHPGFGTLSVGLVYMDYGTFTETDEFAVETGNEFSANEIALGVGVSNFLDKNWAYGVNAKYVFSKIADFNASAVALDFGLIYDAPFQDNLHFAFSVLNIGNNFEYYGKRKESLPLSMRLGLTKKLAHLPLELGVSLNDINVTSEDFADRLKRFSIGGEFTLSKSLRLRLGYNNDLKNSLNTENESGSNFGGVSGGLGFYLKRFRFDYSYSSFGLLGSTHRFGIAGWLD